MKKTVIILCAIFLFFVSACGNTKTIEDNAIISTTAKKTSAIYTEAETNNVTNQSTKKQKETSTKPNKAEKVSQQNNIPPYILSVNLNDLIQIKSATNSMNEADFIEFMNKNFPNAVMNGIDDLSQAKQLLSELEKSYIPLLDGDKNNFSTISFYLESNEFHQLTYFGEKSRIVAYVHTAENIEQSGIMFNNMENAIIVKNIETDTYSAKIYTVENKEHFFVDLFIDDFYIFFRTHDVATIEEFEANFARLKFVKIGDLLNE